MKCSKTLVNGIGFFAYGATQEEAAHRAQVRADQYLETATLTKAELQHMEDLAVRTFDVYADDPLGPPHLLLSTPVSRICDCDVPQKYRPIHHLLTCPRSPWTQRKLHRESLSVGTPRYDAGPDTEITIWPVSAEEHDRTCIKK